jgi:hypothetical protein
MQESNLKQDHKTWSEIVFSEHEVPIIINVKKVISGITINIIDNKQIYKEKNKIQFDAIEAIKTKFNIEEGKVEVYLLNLEEKSCHENDLTNLISYIGVSFKSNDLIQDLADRVNILKNEIVELKENIFELKKNIFELQENVYKVRLCGMIELGRQYYWKIYSYLYKEEFGTIDYIISRQDYDQELNKIIIIDLPKFWSHFMMFVQKEILSDNNCKGLVNLLKGGKGSDYNSLSIDIQNFGYWLLASLRPFNMHSKLSKH